MEFPTYTSFRRTLMGPSIWSAADHFLVLQGVLVQRIHRVYFTDLQAVEVRPTHRRLRQVFFSLITVLLLGGIAWNYPVEEARIPLFICAAAALGALLLAVVSGPTVTLLLHTRTTAVPVKVVSRLGTVRKLLEWIETRVGPVQGEGWYADPDGPDAPPRMQASSAVTMPRIPGWWVVSGCLAASGGYLYAATQVSFASWMAAILGSLLVFFITLGVLIRHREVRPDDPVRGWMALVLAVALFLMYSGITGWSALLGIFSSLEDSGTELGIAASGIEQFGLPLLVGAAQALAAVFLLLSLFGVLRLIRYASNPTSSDDE